MLDFVSWYFSSIAEFWGSAVRIGLPQILLIILLVCWLRRRGCGSRRGKSSCCWGWWGGGSDGPADSACPRDGCACTCGCCCCCQGSPATSGHAEGGEGDA